MEQGVEGDRRVYEYLVQERKMERKSITVLVRLLFSLI